MSTRDEIEPSISIPPSLKQQLICITPEHYAELTTPPAPGEVRLVFSRTDAELIRDGLERENQTIGLYPGLGRLLSFLNGALNETPEGQKP